MHNLYQLKRDIIDYGASGQFSASPSKSKDVLELMRFLKDVRTKHPKGRIISMSELTRDLVQDEKALLSRDSDSKYFAVDCIGVMH